MGTLGEVELGKGSNYLNMLCNSFDFWQIKKNIEKPIKIRAFSNRDYENSLKIGLSKSIDIVE